MAKNNSRADTAPSPNSTMKQQATSSSVSNRPFFKRTSPSAQNLIEIGILTCGKKNYSHIEDIWGPFMNPIDEWPRLTGMVMTMVWDIDKTDTEAFSKKYDVKVVDNYYDMVGKVDGIIISDYYATGWFPQLSRPYLEAGIPILINRPFALSLLEAREMIDRARTNKTPILVPSSHESIFETIMTKFQLERAGEILGAMALDPCGEYPAHGTHGIYNLHEILQTPSLAASFQGDTWWGFKNGMMNILFKGKETAPNFYAGLLFNGEGYTDGWINVSAKNGHIFTPYHHLGHEEIFQGKYDRFRDLFLTTMQDLQRMIETRKMPQTYDHIWNKTQCFIAGFYSHLVKDGQMVHYEDIPLDWRAPSSKPDRFPGGYFN